MDMEVLVSPAKFISGFRLSSVRSFTFFRLSPILHMRWKGSEICALLG